MNPFIFKSPRFPLLWLLVAYSVAFLCLLTPAHANWALDHYLVQQEGVELRQTREYPNPPVLIHEKRYRPESDSRIDQVITAPPNNALYLTSAANFNVVGMATAPTNINVTLKVTPIYKWQGNEVPSQKFYTLESSELTMFQSSPVEEKPLEILQAHNGFKNVSFALSSPYPSVSQGSNSKTHWNQWTVPAGQTEYTGATRTLKINAKVKSYVANDQNEYHFSSYIGVKYQAQVVPFSLNLTTAHHIATITDTPDYKYHIAEADRAWKGTAIGDPIQMFYDGRADYEVSGDTLLSALGNPRFLWHVYNQGGNSSNKVVKPWDIFGDVAVPPTPTPTPAPESQIFKESTVEASTAIKRFHHDVGVKTGGEWQWPQSTTTSVEIEGDNTDQKKLKAQGVVVWYPGPQTRFSTEMDVDVIDLDTGATTPFAQMADGATPIDDEEADIDAYIKEIEDKKDETLTTGKALVEAALNAEMIVGSWYVPDLIADEATGQVNPLTFLPIIGKVAKAVKVARVLDRAVGVANKLGPKSLKMIQRLKPEGRFILRIRNRAIRSGPAHALPPGITQAVGEEANGVVAKTGCFFGNFCFSADTPVVMSNGALKPIEQIQVGDQVLSKDENSGEIAAKRVTHTFVRVAPSTLALTFSNGEKIETTDEHPFYVQGRGFTPAGLVALGNSIVTRAGPPLAVTGIEKKDKSQTVYNFSVTDFHTYFVGKSSFWTHNQGCGIIAYGPSAGGALSAFANSHGIITLTSIPKEGTETMWEFSQFIMEKYREGGGKIYFDLTHMDDIPGCLAGTYRTTTGVDPMTAKELRYIRDNWSRFSGTVTFFENGAAKASPPW